VADGSNRLDSSKPAGAQSPPHPQPPLEAVLWLAPFKEMPLVDPHIVISGFESLAGSGGGSGSGNAVKFAVEAAGGAALLVQLSPPRGLRGRFSDNGIAALLPCERRGIVFYPEEDGRDDDDEQHAPWASEGGGGGDELVQALRDGLVAESLWDHSRFDDDG
jgi:hypothetical protein